MKLKLELGLKEPNRVGLWVCGSNQFKGIYKGCETHIIHFWSLFLSLLLTPTEIALFSLYTAGDNSGFLLRLESSRRRGGQPL